MTSKEIEKKIDYLIQAEDQDLVSWDDDGNVINIQYLKDIKSYIEQLEKDLELLEELKSYTTLENENVDYNILFSNIDYKDYDKMSKEWEQVKG